MDFICYEAALRNENEEDNNRMYDYSLYFSVDNEGEEMKLFETMKRFFPFKFRFLKSKPFKELVVFLPNTTKNRALEFSAALKRELKNYDKNKKKEEHTKKIIKQKNLTPIIPKKFLAITGYKDHETISVFDENHALLFEIEKSKYIINTVKKLMGDYGNG